MHHAQFYSTFLSYLPVFVVIWGDFMEELGGDGGFSGICFLFFNFLIIIFIDT